jgi:tetratricopeptide (TPR) repeat protein
MESPLRTVGQFREGIISFRQHVLHAEVLLAQDSTEKTIALCEKLTSPQPVPSVGMADLVAYNVPFVRDVAARAYERSGDLNKAIAEYERLTTFDPDSDDRRLIHPKHHYRLARLYEETDLSEKAIEQYEKFLEIWSNADPGTPEVGDAKTRLARLKAAS